MVSPSIITLDAYCEAKLYTRTKETNICRTANTFDEAVMALKKIAPVNQVSGVFIIPHTENNVDDEYNERTMTHVLKKAGYNEIRVLDVLPFHYSMIMANSKVRCKVGETVCIESIGQSAPHRFLRIFRKTVNGYEFVCTLSLVSQVFKNYPKLTKVIIDSSIRVPNASKRRIIEDYLPLKVQFVTSATELRSYLWSLVDGKNFGGNLVTMDVRCEFRITFDDEIIFASTRMDLVPWKNSICLDIDNADFLEVAINYQGKTENLKHFDLHRGEHYVKVFLTLIEKGVPGVDVNVINEREYIESRCETNGAAELLGFSEEMFISLGINN